MKIVTSIDHQSKKHKLLVIENHEELNAFTEISQLLRSKQSVSFWFGLKSSWYANDALSYVGHEAGNAAIEQALAIKMTFAEKMSIVDFCNTADTYINQMHENMLKFMDKGEFIRVNYHGGYCPIKPDLSGYDEVIEINHQQMYNYLVHKDTDFDFKIKAKAIVIENAARWYPKELVQKASEMLSIPPDEIQLINNFKQHTMMFKDEDYFRFFMDGIHQGLETIIFESSGTDKNQIVNMKRLMEAIYSRPETKDKKLTLIARASEKLQTELTATNPNISIKFI